MNVVKKVLPHQKSRKEYDVSCSRDGLGHTGTPHFEKFGSTSIDISASFIRPRYRYPTFRYVRYAYARISGCRNTLRNTPLQRVWQLSFIHLPIMSNLKFSFISSPRHFTPHFESVIGFSPATPYSTPIWIRAQFFCFVRIFKTITCGPPLYYCHQQGIQPID